MSCADAKDDGDWGARARPRRIAARLAIALRSPTYSDRVSGTGDAPLKNSDGKTGLQPPTLFRRSARSTFRVKFA